MRLSLPKASKEYNCNHCSGPIDQGEQHACILLGTNVDYVANKALNMNYYLTIRLHLDCFPIWAQVRPRRAKRYKGRKPTMIRRYEQTPDGPEAFKEIEERLTDTQLHRRKVLVTLYHRHRHDRDIGYILEEMEELGGIPKSWLS